MSQTVENAHWTLMQTVKNAERSGTNSGRNVHVHPSKTKETLYDCTVQFNSKLVAFENGPIARVLKADSCRYKFLEVEMFLESLNN